MAAPREEEGGGVGREGEGRSGREGGGGSCTWKQLCMCRCYKLHGNKLLLVLKTYTSTK